MKRLLILCAVVAALVALPIVPASAATGDNCKIPRGGDADNNGIGDAGVQVVCNYDSVYAYDANGDYYWDLGDGRGDTTAGITSVADLDAATLSVCDYRVHSKGDFGNNQFMDSGDISNMIRCYGYEGTSTYHYQIVSQEDPRYTGNPDFAIWGTWEYHVLTESHSGNLVAHTPQP